jgi:signal recognition particle subunit SRP54
MATDSFTLADMLLQMQQVKKMGSMEKLMEMMPGAASMLGPQGVDTEGMKHEEAIILSRPKKSGRTTSFWARIAESASPGVPAPPWQR